MYQLQDGEQFLVMQARSPVFKSMLESGMMEGETGEVSITDMNPDVFRALLHFIYSDDLPEELQVQSCPHLIVFQSCLYTLSTESKSLCNCFDAFHRLPMPGMFMCALIQIFLKSLCSDRILYATRLCRRAA
jgi:BTB/POZ domain